MRKKVEVKARLREWESETESERADWKSDSFYQSYNESIRQKRNYDNKNYRKKLTDETET